MGWIDRFLSRAVVTGFLIGAAIHVVIDELPKLAGLCGLPPGFFANLKMIEGSREALEVLSQFSQIYIVSAATVAPVRASISTPVRW